MNNDDDDVEEEEEEEDIVIFIMSYYNPTVHVLFAKNFPFRFLSLEIQKVLMKLSKEKNCEIIGQWRKACVWHFYWAVT